jgi:MIP family channel proteins
MDLRFRTYVAELLGTFALVFVGAGTVCATFLTSLPPLDVTAIALAEGFTLAVVLTVTFPVSPGCLNPAITLMLWVFKRLDFRQTLTLIIVQLLGATLAGLALRLLFADGVLQAARFGAPHLKALLDRDQLVTLPALGTGIAVEAGLTFLVTCAVFATLLDRRGPRVGGLLVGLAQAAVVLFGFRLTGAAANPARWFGPAVVSGQYPDAWIYIVGPVLGTLAAAFLYTLLVLHPQEREAEAPIEHLA